MFCHWCRDRHTANEREGWSKTRLQYGPCRPSAMVGGNLSSCAGQASDALGLHQASRRSSLQGGATKRRASTVRPGQAMNPSPAANLRLSACKVPRTWLRSHCAASGGVQVLHQALLHGLRHDLRVHRHVGLFAQNAQRCWTTSLNTGQPPHRQSAARCWARRSSHRR